MLAVSKKLDLEWGDFSSIVNLLPLERTRAKSLQVSSTVMPFVEPAIRDLLHCFVALKQEHDIRGHEMQGVGGEMRRDFDGRHALPVTARAVRQGWQAGFHRRTQTREVALHLRRY